jgi:hypothetical protein
MIRIIVTVAALAVIPSAYAQSVPIETDAVINKDAPRGAIDPAVALIRAKGWRCDSVSAMIPFIMSRGFSITCNRFNYKYEIEGRGGNWEVTLK